MLKRTTIEIDRELLDRAKRALGESTARGTVEQALRQAAQSAETEQARRADRQRHCLKALATRADDPLVQSLFDSVRVDTEAEYPELEELAPESRAPADA